MSQTFRYHSLDEARAEILKRSADPALRREVESFLGEKLLPPFRQSPKAFIFRQIASPDQAIAMFWYFSRYLNLDPLILEFHEDTFSAGNDDKMQFIRPLVADETGKLQYIGLASRQASNQRKLSELKCWDGRPLIEFHHGLMKKSECPLATHEASAWLKNLGKARDYYPHLFAHCIAHAVQVEYFDLEHSGSETSWVADVVQSAFQAVRERFGLDPIIVKLCPDGLADRDYRFYWQYPPAINRHLLELARQHRLPMFPYTGEDK